VTAVVDHDQRFKRLLKEFLPEFFGLFFFDWFDRFDFSKVSWLEQELFLDPPQGKRSTVDLIAQLPIRPSDQSRPNEPRQMTALIHVEVESSETVEPFRERMHDYHHYLSRKLGLDILPIAIYLNVGLDGRGTDAFEKWFWERRILCFEYDYVGLPGLPAQPFLEGDNALGIAWSALMKMPRQQRPLAAVEALDRIVASPESSARKHMLCECVQAYAPLDENQRIELNDLLNEPKREGVRAMNKTWTEEGIELGESRERLRMVRQLLETRFKTALNSAAVKRLSSRTPDELNQLSIDLLSANSLKELGLED
jgi:hypothetical protein